MPIYDFRTPRLFVEAPLASGGQVELDRDAANYLHNVLRLDTGDAVLLFNGQDGEWQGTLAEIRKRAVVVALGAQHRPQPPANDLHYLFAPLKHARLDYMVQKAVEMGASRLQPVMTQFTQSSRVNLERMRANAIEAAQQCGILALPTIGETMGLDAAIAALGADRLLIFCDEDAELADPVAALRHAMTDMPSARPLPMALLVGPEGGFSETERRALAGRRPMVRLSLGPRILRADTAAVAALAVVQAVLGDWSV